MTIYYSPANRPLDEEDRQRAVDASGFMQGAGDPALAAIVREAADLLAAPMAAISIVDHDRQYFPVEIGLGVSETPRATSFCAHTMLDRSRPLNVPDATEDARFAGNPIVLSDPEVRFYTGTPLVSEDGQPLGALCVIDRQARETPSADMLEALAALARRAQARAAELRLQYALPRGEVRPCAMLASSNSS